MYVRTYGRTDSPYSTGLRLLRFPPEPLPKNALPMDGWMDGRTDGRTDRRNFSPFYKTFFPVGAAAQKGKKLPAIYHLIGPSWGGISPIHHPKGTPQSPKATKNAIQIIISLLSGLFNIIQLLPPSNQLRDFTVHTKIEGQLNRRLRLY